MTLLSLFFFSCLYNIDFTDKCVLMMNSVVVWSVSGSIQLVIQDPISGPVFLPSLRIPRTVLPCKHVCSPNPQEHIGLEDM